MEPQSQSPHISPALDVNTASTSEQASPLVVSPTLDLIEKLRQDRAQSSFVPEITRICNMPIIPDLTPEQVEQFSRNNVLAPMYERGFRYFDVQAKAVMSYDMWGGLFCFIGCGFGKTAITLLVAYRAFRRGIKKSILLIPPEVYLQLVKTDIPKERGRTPLGGLPFIKLGKAGAYEREIAAENTTAGCFIMPYSMLSTKNAEQVLKSIAPQLIIADEAHTLKNREAARTKRLMRYVEANNPQFVALSGSMTNKGIKDYHHLIRAALGNNCPLPRTWTEAKEWGLVVDSTSEPTDEQLRVMGPMMSWAREKFPDKNFTIDYTGYRKAYQARLTTSPGVISSGDKAIPTSLIVRNTPIKTYRMEGTKEIIDEPGGDKLIELMKQVSDLMISPNGDELADAMHKFLWLYELTAGFYYETRWPTPEHVLAVRGPKYAEEGKVYTLEMAKESLDMAQKHYDANQAFFPAMRAWLDSHARPGMDTPGLIILDMARNGPRNTNNELYRLWLVSRSFSKDPHGYPKLVEQLKKGIPVCGYKVNRAVEWALVALKDKPAKVRKDSNGVEYVDEEMRGGIIWVNHVYMGRWVFSAIKKALMDTGIPEAEIKNHLLYCPRGAEADAELRKIANGNKILVTSLAHRTGKNLQHMQKQLYLQFPRPADWAEQSLSRIHRTGQLADEVYVDTCNTTLFDYKVFSACLNDALYQHQTTNTRQRVVYAVYSPPMKIFPPEVLREQGLSPMDIGEEGRRRLMEMGEQNDV